MKESSYKNNRILILGGTGFIGSHIVKKALFLGFNVTVICKNERSLSQAIKNVDYLLVDISQEDKVTQLLQNKSFHYIINLSGYVNHVDIFSGGDNVFDVHFSGIKNLIYALNLNNLKNFIQIGSSDEYGNNSAPQFEGQRESPFSPYSFAKVASTHFLQTLFKLENFPAVILRPFLVYGPGQDEKRFIPQIIKGCLNDKKFPTSKGEQLRDFCFIDDFVSAVFLALENKNVQGEVINISSGKPISIRKVTELIVNMIGSGRPQFGHFDYRQGESMSLYAEIEKANDLLDWKPIVKIEKGIAETIKWMKSCKNEL